MGRVGTSCRRVSFFNPSPTANPVGVEEGHLDLAKVPFFFVAEGTKLLGFREPGLASKKGGALC